MLRLWVFLLHKRAGSHGAKSAEQSENKLRIVRSQAAPCVKQDSLRLNSSKFMEMFQQILFRVEFNFIVSVSGSPYVTNGNIVTGEHFSTGKMEGWINNRQLLANHCGN